MFFNFSLLLGSNSSKIAGRHSFLRIRLIAALLVSAEPLKCKSPIRGRVSLFKTIVDLPVPDGPVTHMCGRQGKHPAKLLISAQPVASTADVSLIKGKLSKRLTNCSPSSLLATVEK